MITKKYKSLIKDIVGHRYVTPIQDELNNRKEFNKDGEAYSRSQITNVMNGERHEVIEAAIFRVVESKKKELEERKIILKNNLITKDEL